MRENDVSDPAPGTKDQRRRGTRNSSEHTGFAADVPRRERTRRHYIDASYGTAADLRVMTLVGDRSVLEGAFKVAHEFGDLGRAYRPTRGRRRTPPAEYTRARTTISSSFVDCAETARLDLQSVRDATPR
jgi:hypothetical protein